MVGLTAIRGEVALPLSSWGAGTRRLAALAITEQNQSEVPITVVDKSNAVWSRIGNAC